MHDAAPDGRSFALRLATLLVLAAALAIVTYFLWGIRNDAGTEPLNPHDSMEFWRAASPARKQATAELLLLEMQSTGAVGPSTAAFLKHPDDVRLLSYELVQALDDATDRNKQAYVSPGKSIVSTAEALAAQKHWNQ